MRCRRTYVLKSVWKESLEYFVAHYLSFIKNGNYCLKWGFLTLKWNLVLDFLILKCYFSHNFRAISEISATLILISEFLKWNKANSNAGKPILCRKNRGNYAESTILTKKYYSFKDHWSSQYSPLCLRISSSLGIVTWLS